nr:hypothetical protein [Actinomycetota bacterium]
LFDRFAGIFHAFGCLERTVKEALDSKNERDAAYRLFGKKYDSLGTLLDKVPSDGDRDDVDRYVILLCAQQLCSELDRAYPDYWRAHRSDVGQLEERLRSASGIRERLVAKDPNDMPGFLEWFDRWFLRRTASVEVDA